MLGVIGGSGLYDLPELEVVERRAVQTPYGTPSDELVVGRLKETEIVFLSRHGVGHRHTPTELPYRANIHALKSAGVTHLVTVSAVGSLREHLPPLTVVLPDQIIDRTFARDPSFFGDGAVAHVGIADPFCHRFSKWIARAANNVDQAVVSGGTYVCIEGPQFSTRAESQLYRSWGGSVIGMTAMPEARLAREAEFCYATLAMVTDFDVWHETEEAVHVELVQANHRKNMITARAILAAIAEAGLPDRDCACGSALQGAIVTDPELISDETRSRLGVIASKYLARANVGS